MNIEIFLCTIVFMYLISFSIFIILEIFDIKTETDKEKVAIQKVEDAQKLHLTKYISVIIDILKQKDAKIYSIDEDYINIKTKELYSVQITIERRIKENI